MLVPPDPMTCHGAPRQKRRYANVNQHYIYNAKIPMDNEYRHETNNMIYYKAIDAMA